MKRSTLILAALALLLGGGAGTSRAETIYVAGSGNEFGTLDLSTGSFTDIGTLNLPVGDSIFGMGFGADGKLYGLDASQPNANLYLINTTTAQVTLVGSVDESTIGATSDASGKMYALSQDFNANFYTLNPPSTTTNGGTPTGISSQGLAAVTADGSQFFTTTIDPVTATYDLTSINTTTGAATVIGDTGFYEIAGQFVQGTLYGFDDNTNAIVTINTTTGAGTQVGTYTLPNGDAIFASALAPQVSAVPEPSTITLLGIGSLSLLGYGWRLRRRAVA